MRVLKPLVRLAMRQRIRANHRRSQRGEMAADERAAVNLALERRHRRLAAAATRPCERRRPLIRAMLAAIVLTRNEERHLPDCLSLAGLGAGSRRLRFVQHRPHRALARAAGARVEQRAFDTTLASARRR